MKSALVLGGVVLKYLNILQGVAQGCTLPPNIFKVYSNLIVAVGAAKQGVTVGGDTVSGSIFSDDFVGILETPEGLKKQTRKARHRTSRWRVTASVKKCAVAACNADKVHPVKFSRKWGEDGVPIVNQHTDLSVDISEDCFWDTHIEKCNAHIR